jgi:hypothetical protein
MLVQLWRSVVTLCSTHNFQHSLFLRVTTLLTGLKSTLLLKIKCFDTTIYMKTQCLQTNEMLHYCRKENAWEAGRGRERVALIKSLITRDRKDALEARLQKIELNLSADIILNRNEIHQLKIFFILLHTCFCACKHEKWKHIILKVNFKTIANSNWKWRKRKRWFKMKHPFVGKWKWKFEE